MVTGGYMVLQGVTGGYRGLQGVKRDYMGLQGPSIVMAVIRSHP